MRRKTYLEWAVDQFIKMAAPSLSSAPPMERAKTALAFLTAQAHRVQTDPAMQKAVAGQFHDLMFNREMLASCVAGDPIYKIAENFGQHLDRAKLDVRCEDLPVESGEFFNIELPDSIEFTNGEGDYFKTVLVSIGEYDPSLKHDWRMLTTAEFYNQKPGQKNPRMLGILAPDHSAAGERSLRSSYTIYPIPDGMTLGEALEHHVGHKVIVGRHLAQFVGKCLVYLKSDNAELRREAGRFLTTKKEKKQRAFNRDNCPFDVSYVGYGYHNRVFHMDETGVVGHFRTYHTGPGRTVPLTRWVDDHVRRFNKDVEEKLHAAQVLPRPGVEARP